MNFLLAGVVFALAYATGFPTPVNVAIAAVSPGAPADTAGVRVDDVILEMGGQAITASKSFDKSHVMASGLRFRCEYSVASRSLSLQLRPARIPGGAGCGRRRDPATAQVRPVQHNPIDSVYLGFRRAVEIVGFTLAAPFLALRGLMSPDMLRPIGLRAWPR